MTTQLAPNSFTSYVMSDQDVIEGSIFTVLQTQVLHNLRSTYAESKIALDYDPEHKEKFLQDEASLKAKIDLLTYLLDNSEAVQFELANFNKQQQQTTEE